MLRRRKGKEKRESLEGKRGLVWIKVKKRGREKDGEERDWKRKDIGNEKQNKKGEEGKE